MLSLADDTEIELGTSCRFAGALEYLLLECDCNAEEKLVKKLKSDGTDEKTELLRKTLVECNLKPKVVSDNKHKNLTPETFSARIFAVKQRLNSDAHPRLSADEFKRHGERILLKSNGISLSDAIVLRTLFELFGYPVQFYEDNDQTFGRIT